MPQLSNYLSLVFNEKISASSQSQFDFRNINNLASFLNFLLVDSRRLRVDHKIRSCLRCKMNMYTKLQVNRSDSWKDILIRT